jgi:drug/metabolite transporter, DME family
MSSGQVGSVDVVPDAALHAISPTSPAADTSVIEVPPTAAAIDHTRANLHGVLLGLAAAVTYSIANLALRGLAKTDSGLGWSMWVAGTKAFPTFFVAVILICVRRWRGQASFTNWNFVWPIAVAAFFNQLGGNLALQMSLVEIGLAITVPICFSSIICSGAIVGRFVLGDAVSVRTGISMGLMVASIIFLSTAATNRTVAALSATTLPADDDWGTATGVALAMTAGLAYGITGVYIRKAVRSQMPVAATLFLFSAAGFLVLCPLSLTLLPLSTIAATTEQEWAMIAAAGIFNAIGFFAITHAMRHLTISRTNVINASQNALCAVGAVIVFGESLSAFGLLGIGLTIAGLLTLDRK